MAEDKKLTDSEIVKILEICARPLPHCYCDECPAGANGGCAMKTEYVIDLINRLQAENERLKNVKSHIDILIHRGVEYPTAETYNKAFQKALEKLYDNTNSKAEAYKEFAERLKRNEGRRGVPIGTIDNLLKELVGEE